MARLLVVCVCLAASVNQAGPPAASLAYKGARLLCTEHVNAGPIHIVWQSHATSDPVDTVVAHYERTTGQKATVRADGAHRIELQADHYLSIYPSASNDAFPHCGVKPTPRERTVIQISEAARQ